MSRDPSLLLEDIFLACQRIVRYTEGMSYEAVFEDE
ncbi:hypothetical protein TNMX_05935 [Thermus sp. NMX2.A1]|nr:hypothetical protein TNMX_05935 [Thermus sp. NMX2.A1]